MNNMNKKLLEALSEQLKEEGSCAFKHKGYYYNIYELCDNADVYGYGYDKYESMDSDVAICACVDCENDDAEEAISFAII